jgi:hypothetical protein
VAPYLVRQVVHKESVYQMLHREDTKSHLKLYEASIEVTNRVLFSLVFTSLMQQLKQFNRFHSKIHISMAWALYLSVWLS